MSFACNANASVLVPFIKDLVTEQSRLFLCGLDLLVLSPKALVLVARLHSAPCLSGVTLVLYSNREQVLRYGIGHDLALLD